MKLNRRAFIIALTSLLALLLTAFIFGNSLQTGEESGEMSDFILSLIKKPLRLIGISVSDELLGFLIRKAAHFSEYFVLGALMSIDLINIFKSKIVFAFAPIYPFFIAICDEFIVQRATEGRSPEIRDVLIDLSGAIFGTLLVYFIVQCRNKKKQI